MNAVPSRAARSGNGARTIGQSHGKPRAQRCCGKNQWSHRPGRGDANVIEHQVAVVFRGPAVVQINIRICPASETRFR